MRVEETYALLFTSLARIRTTDVSLSGVSLICDVLANSTDLHRATSIMGSILTELEDPLDVFADLAEEERESLAALQDVLDIVQSPLFSAIVDIRDQCKKVCVECLQ